MGFRGARDKLEESRALQGVWSTGEMRTGGWGSWGGSGCHKQEKPGRSWGWESGRRTELSLGQNQTRVES